MDTLSEDGLSDAAKQRIKDKINAIEDDISELTSSIKKMESLKIDDSYVKNKISSIKKAIEDLRNFTILDRDRILNYVERINIFNNGDIDIILKSGKTIVVKKDLPLKGDSNNKLPCEDNVVKMRSQDALYSSPEAYRAPRLHGTRQREYGLALAEVPSESNPGWKPHLFPARWHFWFLAVPGSGFR